MCFSMVFLLFSVCFCNGATRGVVWLSWLWNLSVCIFLGSLYDLLPPMRRTEIVLFLDRIPAIT